MILVEKVVEASWTRHAPSYNSCHLLSFSRRKIRENDEDANIEAITNLISYTIHLLSSAMPEGASRSPTPTPGVTPEPPANHTATTEETTN